MKLFIGIVWISLFLQCKALPTDSKEINYDYGTLRVAGGHDMKTVPYLVRIETFMKADATMIVNKCAGAIISTVGDVLTTASCFVGSNGAKTADSATVKAGSGDLGTPGTTDQSTTASSITIHEKYYINTLGYDIALIKLKKPFTIDTTNVAMIKIPKGKPDDLPGKTAISVIGWGYNSSDPTTFGNYSVAQKIDRIEVAKSKDCKTVLATNHYSLPETDLCANVTGSNGLCLEDQGALATAYLEIDKVKQDALVGLGHAWVGQTCPSKLPNLFVHVPTLAKWIESKGGPTAPK